MINVSAALCADTTATCHMQLLIDGYYDDDNLWVAGGYGPLIKFAACPIPLGDYETGMHGETLKADLTGERKPIEFKFHSLLEMPINARITYKGMVFKVIKHSDYSAGGYYSAVGVTDTTTTDTVSGSYPLDFTINRRGKPINAELLRSIS